MNNNPDVKYQVFVSSTYVDLIEERKEITQAILEAHCIPAGMELFPASSKSQWEFIKHVIDESDFYLLIVAGKYGSEGIDESGKRVSYTEMEFDYAVKTNKPIIALIHADLDSLPRNKCETSKVKNAKLMKFYAKVSTGRLIKKWTNKDNLKSAALSALFEATHSGDNNAIGWIRADRVPAIIDQTNEQSAKRIKELEASLDSAWSSSRIQQGNNERLQKIIYDAYFNPSTLQNNEEVDEIIGALQYASGFRHQHE